MIAWMVWSLLFTVLIALCALAVERIASNHNFARRFIWMAAIVVCVVSPVALALRPADPVVMSTVASIDGVFPSIEGATANMDGWVLRIWLLLSMSVLAVFGFAALSMMRKRSEWLEADLNDCRAFITHDVGPAVVGFIRPRVVVPQWTMTLDESSRRMILRHEVEHLRARDPQALFLTGIVLVALPWNLPLWWIVMRMRLAMELDCDARVVRNTGATYEYGKVLLAVGERHIRSVPLAASLAGRKPLLESRIRAITTKKPRWPMLASVPLIVFLLMVMIAATHAPLPAPVVVSTPASSDASIGGNPVISIGVDSDQARAEWARQTAAQLNGLAPVAGSSSGGVAGGVGGVGGGRGGGGGGSGAAALRSGGQGGGMATARSGGGGRGGSGLGAVTRRGGGGGGAAGRGAPRTGAGGGDY